MGVSDADVEAFLACPTRAYLRSITAEPSDQRFPEHRVRVADFFRHQQRTALKQKMVAGQFPLGAAIRDAFRQTGSRLLFDCRIAAGSIDTTLHAVEEIAGTGEQSPAQFVPVRHIAGARIAKEHRVLLAFDAVALEKRTGETANFGRLVHGTHASISRVKLTPRLLNEARHVIDSIIAMLQADKPPELVLHKGCSDCEFQSRCQAIAKETDDLSLIASMPKSNRQKLHQKGIFTVTQLSYTFRLRRNRKDPDAVYSKRHDALRALAIREQKTHVLGKPDLNLGTNPVYLDVEGQPDVSCYYLIGICYPEHDCLVYKAFWADSPSQEERMWNAFLTVLKGLNEPTIVHYGNHAASEVWRMLGSMELLPQSTRIELGEMILDFVPRRKFEAIRPALLWALGRIGARVPVYGPLNVVISPEIIERWVTNIGEASELSDPIVHLTLMQMARRTDDRYRDVSELLRSQVISWLEIGGARSHFVDLVQEGGTLDGDESRLVFGESLPAGLRLV